MNSSSFEKIEIYLFGLLVFAFYFPFTASTPLLGPWEPHYGQVAREMLYNGNWFTPLYKGGTFWTKPILAPFLVTFSYAIFGVTEFATRLPAVLTGGFGLIAIFAITKRNFNNKLAWCIGLVLMLTPLYALMSRRFLTDIFFTVPLMLALTWFFIAIEKNKPKKAMLAWAFVALSVLAKGLLPIFITIGTLASYMVITGNLSKWRRLSPLTGFIIFLAVSVPWHAYMTAKYSATFLKVWFIDNHFGRVAGSIGKPVGTYEFFLMFLGFGAFPVISFTPLGFLALNEKKNDLLKSFTIFNLCYFAAAGFIIFSSSTKFAHYVFAMIPPLITIAGIGLYKVLGDESTNKELKLLMLMFVGIMLIVIGKDYSSGHSWFNYITMTSDHKIRDFMGRFGDFRPMVKVATAGVLFGVFLMIFRFKKIYLAGAAIAFLAAIAYLGHTLYVFDPALLNAFSPKSAMVKYEEMATDNEPLITYKSWKWRSETWYAKKDNPVMEIKSSRRLQSILKNRTGKRSFISTPKGNFNAIKRIARSMGATVTEIASDQTGSFKENILVLVESTAKRQTANTKPKAVDINKIQKKTSLSFEKATIVGVNIPKEAKAGDRINISIFWRADKPFIDSWMRFMHVEGAENLRIVRDNDPYGNGNMLDWKQGQVVEDKQKLTIPSDVSSGTFQIWVGLYNDNKRMKILDKSQVNNRIKIGEIDII